MLDQVLLTIFLIILFFLLTLFAIFCNHPEQWIHEDDEDEPDNQDNQDPDDESLSVASTATYDSISMSIDVPQDPVI